MDNYRCTCEIIGLSFHDCGRPARGRTAAAPCPSEAAYRRELRHGGPVHPACRKAATATRAAREAARGVTSASRRQFDPAALWPCGCPPILPDLESTLAYGHPYGWVTGTGWVHE